LHHAMELKIVSSATLPPGKAVTVMVRVTAVIVALVGRLPRGRT
jgi:hypothetical protein